MLIEFIADCAVWTAFAASNYAVTLKDVPYQGAVYQIRNNFYPFLLDEVKRWPCGNSDLTAQLLVANEDRFLAKWLAGVADARDARPYRNRTLLVGRRVPRRRSRPRRRR